MCPDLDKFHAYTRELLGAYASREIEEVVTPCGKKDTALRVSGLAHFTSLMRNFLISTGIVESDYFKTINQEDPATLGSIAHLRSIFREDQERRYEDRKHLADARFEEIRSRAIESRRNSPMPKMDPAIKAKLLKELQSGPKPADPEEVARKAAEEVRRINDQQ